MNESVRQTINTNTTYHAYFRSDPVVCDAAAGFRLFSATGIDISNSTPQARFRPPVAASLPDPLQSADCLRSLTPIRTAGLTRVSPAEHKKTLPRYGVSTQPCFRARASLC